MGQNQKSRVTELIAHIFRQFFAVPLIAELLQIDLAEYGRKKQEIEAKFGSDAFTQARASLDRFVLRYLPTTRFIGDKITLFLESALIENHITEEMKYQVWELLHNNIYFSYSDFPYPQWVTLPYHYLYRYFLLSQIIDPMCLLILLEEGKVVEQDREILRMEILITIYAELEEINNMCGIIADEYMEKLQQQIETSAAMRLDQRLERAGAYERLTQLDPRGAAMLQTYLTTEKSMSEVGKEVGLRSRTSAHQIIHSSMEIAFSALPEEERAEYDNDPTAALRTRSAQQTKTKGERIREAHSHLPRNPETGKIQFPKSQIDRMSASQTLRQRREHQAAPRAGLGNGRRPAAR